MRRDGWDKTLIASGEQKNGGSDASVLVWVRAGGKELACRFSPRDDDDGDTRPTAVIPAKAVQYAASFQFYHERLGILDRPNTSRTMTVGVECAGRNSALSRHAALEVCKSFAPGKTGCALHPRSRAQR
jgi:hypothetical protein